MTELTKKQVDLIVQARWILPVVPSNKVLERSCLVINDGIIIDIIDIDVCNLKYSATKTICLMDHVLIPGLINLHSHLGMTLMRGLADDKSLMPWLEENIWPAEQKLVTERFVRDNALLACAELLSGGVTCFNDMYFYPQATAEAAMQAGIRAQLGLVVLDFPTNYAADADDYIQKGLEARDTWRDNPLLTSSIAPHAPYTVNDSTYETIITYAEQLDLAIHTHLHETLDEVLRSVNHYGVRPIRRLANLGLLGPNLTAAHCVQMNDEDVELIQAHGVHIAHCPTSNLKLGSGIAPVTKMLNAEINIGLGSDSTASNNRLDMFSEMRLAALLAKGMTGNASAVPAHQALEMATINGAKALGLDHIIGSLEVGKSADIAAIRIADVETLPCFDPISHLIYVCGREHVSHVWVSGDLRYEQSVNQMGVFANIEPLELKEIAFLWQSKLNQFKR
jgi:5-methylthioadenosine/S-adenosylhomocysteine deaminase